MFDVTHSSRSFGRQLLDTLTFAFFAAHAAREARPHEWPALREELDAAARAASAAQPDREDVRGRPAASSAYRPSFG